jgi:hypothetical protein
LFGANGTSGVNSNSIRFSNGDSSQKIIVENYNGTGADYYVLTTAVYRDPSAWYHIVATWDTTNGTAADRLRLYVNGSLITASTTGNSIPLNAQSAINSTAAHYIGGNTSYFNGYMAEVNFVDGQALTPSSFGETDAQTGVWVPKRYTGTYGTNGFRLPFTNNSTTTALGYDASGNGNNWTPNNFSVTAGSGNDSLLDVPSLYGTDTGLGGEVRGNYCTLNPLGTGVPGFSGGVTKTYSDGNLQVAFGTGSYFGVTGTFGLPASGKWYWEVIGTVAVPSIGISVGLPYGGSSEVNVRVDNTFIYANGSTSQSGLPGYTTNDLIGVAWNADANSMQFYKNGVAYGSSVSYTPASGATYFPFAIANSSVSAATIIFNFGQRPFAYTAPTGFKALCTTNLSAPAIGQTSTNQADNYFNTVLYNGTGATQSITGVGFQPDLVWVKNRTGTQWHNLTDAVRGTNSQLYSNDTALQGSLTTALTSFNVDGFTVGSAGDWNGSGYSMVAWCWNAGGSTVSNTQGTITSSVRANPSSGFSVVTYTGTGANATVGHGLGVAPSMIILKSRSIVKDWIVGHSSLSSWAYILKLNDTIAQTSVTDVFNSTAPTLNVFSLGSNLTPNTSGATYVAYCFAAIPGFSAFGSYTGNGSADGTFVYLGFRPAFLLIKRTNTSGSSWVLWDTARNIYNVADTVLCPDLSSSEATIGSTLDIDILSNGFKLRNSDSWTNGSSNTYIYAAFAEYPFRLSLAR